jgi:hypothetical protein
MRKMKHGKNESFYKSVQVIQLRSKKTSEIIKYAQDWFGSVFKALSI